MPAVAKSTLLGHMSVRQATAKAMRTDCSMRKLPGKSVHMKTAARAVATAGVDRLQLDLSAATPAQPPSLSLADAALHSRSRVRACVFISVSQSLCFSFHFPYSATAACQPRPLSNTLQKKGSSLLGLLELKYRRDIC